MERDKSKSIYNQHQIVVRIHYLLESIAKVDSLDAHYNDGPLAFVRSVGVDNASS